MNPSGLLQVFSQYDGNVIFQRLVSSTSGSAAILGQIGWLFTAVGAFLILWGHVLRTSRSPTGDRQGELARTLVVFAALIGAPFIMRTLMQGADNVYETTIGGPRNLAVACVKAAFAMPELNHIFDRVGAPSDPVPATLSASDDSTQDGYVESFFLSMWNTASDYVSKVRGTVVEAVRLASIVSGFGAATIKTLLAALTLVPVYLLFLVSAAIIWFMSQVRFLFAVVGTLMLPPFIGMFSLPADHPNRAPAQRYVMNLVSLALWPIGWTVGHAGTIVLFDALAGLIADASRTPALQTLLSWENLSSGTIVTEDQIRAGEVALGNWFMGGVASELAVLVGALGFALWVFLVSVAGPILLHRVFATGALYATEAFREASSLSTKIGSAAAMIPSIAVTAAAPIAAAPLVPEGLGAQYSSEVLMRNVTPVGDARAEHSLETTTLRLMDGPS